MQSVTLTTEELRKLLSCGCPDAVSLYLYQRANEPRETALDALHFTVPRMVAATDCLRQLGLWDDAPRAPIEPARPTYSEADVSNAMRRENFPKLVGEAQRRLGRTLSSEELKVLLSFTDYLRLPTEVVGVLLHYCIERCRRKNVRAPSMRMIEKEAYRWADAHIDTLETASFYVQQQLQLQNRVQQLRLLLQIEQRRMSDSEEQYLRSWAGMGFSDEVIKLAYDRTCINAGGLKWKYMDSILRSWNENHLRTPQEIAVGDVKAPRRPTGKTGFVRHDDALTPLEQEAVRRALLQGQEG